MNRKKQRIRRQHFHISMRRDKTFATGVYGAFLKHWDSRAMKTIVFSRIDTKEGTCQVIFVRLLLRLHWMTL